MTEGNGEAAVEQAAGVLAVAVVERAAATVMERS